MGSRFCKCFFSSDGNSWKKGTSFVGPSACVDEPVQHFVRGFGCVCVYTFCIRSVGKPVSRWRRWWKVRQWSTFANQCFTVSFVRRRTLACWCCVPWIATGKFDSTVSNWFFGRMAGLRQPLHYNFATTRRQAKAKKNGTFARKLCNRTIASTIRTKHASNTTTPSHCLFRDGVKRGTFLRHGTKTR